ncbi:MAG TPA: amidohydrolase family protein, partial [Candidatus Atribacteria bacterium]|nr:amidohydrolase family protein [Candidatus Atribacteria bacterium]
LENKGSIEVGKDADITVFGENLDIAFTMVEGKIVYRNPLK